MQPLARADRVRSDFVTNLSRSVSLSLFAGDGSEMSLVTNMSTPIELIIPRDPHSRPAPMRLQHVTRSNASGLFELQWVNVSAYEYAISMHVQMLPVNGSRSYLFIYKFDGTPRVNSSMRDVDGWRVLCVAGEFAIEIEIEMGVGVDV
jgi:hypothetical protein